MDERIVEALKYLAAEIDDLRNWRMDNRYSPETERTQEHVDYILKQPRVADLNAKWNEIKNAGINREDTK